MLHQHTLQQLKTLRLDGMARAFEEQLTLPIATELAFEDRFAQLVDRELHWRDNQRRDRLLKQAKLKQPQACLEDLDHRPGRGLDKALIASLAGGDWIRQGHALLIGGATGTGKTWLACALGQQACRQGFSTFYTRLPRLLDTLRIAHGDGSFGKRLAQLARLDCSSWMTGDSRRRIKTPGTICWKSSTTASRAVPRSLPANYPSSTGTPGSTIPPWPTPSSTASSTKPIDST